MSNVKQQQKREIKSSIYHEFITIYYKINVFEIRPNRSPQSIVPLYIKFRKWHIRTRKLVCYLLLFLPVVSLQATITDPS